MNKIRRKALCRLVEQIEEIRSVLEDIQCDEEEYRDNMPENLWGSVRYEKAEEAVSNIEDAISSLEDALCSVEAAME